MAETKSADKLHCILAGHVTRHMQGVDAAIGELAGDPGLCGIIAPAHARIVGIGGIGMKAVREFDDDER